MGTSNILIRYCLAIFLCVCLTAGRVLNPSGRGTQGSKPRSKIFFKRNEDLPETTRVPAFTDVELSCEVGGSPSPTVHWNYQTKRIEQGGMLDNRNDQPYYEDSEDKSGNPLIRLSFTRSVLYLDCVTPDMQGEYECVAMSDDKMVVSRTNLVVEDIPDVEAESCVSKRTRGNKIEARPFLWTSNRIEKAGASVQLFCRAEGNPEPNTMWLDNKKRPITEDSVGYKLLPYGDLLIRDISWANVGSYTCIVDNGEGNARKISTFLYPAKS